MEKDIYEVLQSEVEIAKCIKYRGPLLEKTIGQLAIEGRSDFKDMLCRAQQLEHSSLCFFDLPQEQFEYFKAAVIRILQQRQQEFSGLKRG